MKKMYIIEHLESKIWPWCLIEYKNISEIVGKENLWFTNIKNNNKQVKQLSRYGKIISSSVKDLKLKSACVLDPESKFTLTPKDAKKFRYFIFGGILGDYPAMKRTKKELTRFIVCAESRNIGKKQLSTDNAVFVTREIVNGADLSKMKFVNNLEIPINSIESVILPFVYPLQNGKPRISAELIKFIKNKKGF